MGEKTRKKACISLLVLVPALLIAAMFFVANPGGFAAHATESNSLSQTVSGQVQTTILSQKSETECVEFIIENGIIIPADFVDSSELGNFVKWVIQSVEANPNYEFLFSYQITQEFAESIKALVNSSSAVQGQYSMVAAAYTLHDNTQYGSWQSDYPNYNCYSYAIGKTNERYRYPGQHSGISNGIFANYISKYSIGEMANFVKNDLIALGGYGSIYVSNIRPNIISSGETLIAIRKGSSDYHFMKFHPEGGFWTHKPGGTAILRYNHQPADKVWGSEAIINSSGTAQAGSTTYNSEIYYIVYNWSGLAIQGNTITSFTPQAGFNGSLQISDGVTAIAANAFSGCTSLSQISIPASVTSIGSRAFQNTTKLTKITYSSYYPAWIDNTVFSGVDRSKIQLTIPMDTMQDYLNAGWTGFLIRGGR